MLQTRHYEEMASAIRSGARKPELKLVANKIRMELNPHPAGQRSQNMPQIDGVELTGVQHKYRENMRVFAPKPAGGFYLFPNFAFYENNLRNKGISNSGQLCERLLEDTGVALLPSYDFGRPSDELTARLSYVDFDGEKALSLTQTTYQSKNIDEAFIKACCGDMLEAFSHIRSWLQQK